MVKVSPGIYKIHVEKDKKTGDTRVGVKLDKTCFDLPEVIFGDDLEAKAAKVSEIWHRDNKILGAQSIGQKGTGKSTLVELIANNELKNGYPCLLVDEPYSKQVVEEATRILGDCIVLLDEFEKIFSVRHDIGDELLTFFSDRSLGKVLFLITANDIRGLSNFMIHRPGRFLFKFEFEGIKESVVRQICSHFKVNKAVTEFIVKHASAVTESIDSVIALAKNGCHYKAVDKFKELFQWLNVKKPSFKMYKCFISGMKHEEGIEKRFQAFLTDGKFSVTDTVTGMTYDKSQFHKRGSAWSSYQYIGDSNVRIEMTYTEFNEPVEQQTDIPVTVDAIKPMQKPANPF